MAVIISFAGMEQGFQERMMEAKDQQMKATSESLKNMRILKLHAWEMMFLNKILNLRKDKAGWLKKYVNTDIVVTVFFWTAPVFIATVTFLACMLMNIPLESGNCCPPSPQKGYSRIRSTIFPGQFCCWRRRRYLWKESPATSFWKNENQKTWKKL